MNEYELYTRILSPTFIADSQTTLIEKKLAKAHTATIISSGIDSYIIYRYDLDKENFLPFFNKTHDNAELGTKVSYPTPSGLNSFCDYILLATKKDKLYVILIEMKSGNPEGANLQLEASKCFMEYVRSTAERIKGMNDYKSFSSDNIIVKKVILKPAPKARPGTNVSKSNLIDFSADVVKLPSDTFPLYRFCQ